MTSTNHRRTGTRAATIRTALACLLAVATSVMVRDDAVFLESHVMRAGADQPQSAPGPCDDDAYALLPWKLRGTATWFYNPAGTPETVASTALEAIIAATTTVTSGTNACGQPARLPIQHDYAGATTFTPEVAVDGTCTGNDGQSVVGWGSLPAGVLAVTCTSYFEDGLLAASDVLINTGFSWFTDPAARCSEAYDLQSVMTHERGHALGLAHVDQTEHPSLVMSPLTTSCDTSKRSLGLGDYAGLIAHYGTG